MRLNPANGHIIPGCIVDEHSFIATIPSGLLFNIVVDPRRAEDIHARATDASLQDIFEVQKEVQRLFTGAKAENVKPYSDYLERVQLEDMDGEIPTIILWTSEELRAVPLEDRDPLGEIQVPYGVTLIPIDGGTQTAARFRAKERNREFMGAPATIKICHGRSVEWARQAFHDLNVLGVPVNAAVAIAMDNREPLTQVAREVGSAVPLFRGRVNTTSRQLGRRDTDIVTITALRSACVTLAEGIGGVRYGTKPVDVNSDRLPAIRDLAITWFTAVTQLIGMDMEDRVNKVAATPPVLAALGAMGHEMLKYHEGSDRRTLTMEQQLEKLRSVRWEKGDLWEGIAGKFTPKGAFSVGGTKETVYAVFRALNEPESPEGMKVRGVRAPAAVQ